MRSIFGLINRFLMVPMFRLGLGPFIGNPFTGYIMVLKARGWKTGRVRHTPLNYAIVDGQVYCLAGFGRAAHWYRNLRADPHVEILLPSGPLSGVVEEVADPDESARAVRQILKNGGFAGFFLGFNPFTAPDEVLRERTRGLPVLRIRPTGVGSGAGDPGGWLWIVVALVLAWPLLRRLRRC
ncbi:MAG: nitroreductase family deazaflavin-dependent oxidoreductase [Chloroflexi bacterium]|nr:nitroreductase family deazaflavin-dependent oxidoreductase [Chloroflexota bacterium]